MSNMTLLEKIQKKAERYKDTIPIFIEDANSPFENQWISVENDLPCNHKELIFLGGLIDGSETIDVFVRYESGDIWRDYMIYTNGKWRWSDGEPDYWMIAPKLPKE